MNKELKLTNRSLKQNKNISDDFIIIDDYDSCGKKIVKKLTQE